jgi:2-polyprenyl-6-methoxyphenol hydroxylase-like FAD-dependent oxidoreductase
MSRFVIIGGGIAGFSMAISLKKKGHDVVVYERSHPKKHPGHAFLIHPDAYAILLDLIGADSMSKMLSSKIGRLNMYDSDGMHLQEVPLGGWICVKRSEPLRVLAHSLGIEHIRYDRSFVKFIEEDERYSAAIFDDGEIVAADYFIGADGAHSSVRQALFGPTAFTPVMVKELLGTTYDPEIYRKHSNTFRKYLSTSSGLAIGFMPCSIDEIIWFMQFDCSRFIHDISNEDAILDFIRTELSRFPAEVRELVQSPTTRPYYTWNTTDFELLPSFHKKNAVLIGDAAHLALPFTSAGVGNALHDAECLTAEFSARSDFRQACEAFYRQRSPIVAGHVQAGRQIRDSFMQGTRNGIRVPLVS